MAEIWLIKLVLSHLLTDFILQPGKWVEERKANHFRSGYLYLHTLVTAVAALVLLGPAYWKVVLIVFISHTLIDGWKSYRRDTVQVFLVDQALHLLVIICCWLASFYSFSDINTTWSKMVGDRRIWILTTAFVFVTWPAGILIGQLTRKWRNRLNNFDALDNAGKWIGIIERTIILAFVMQHQYEAIGLLVAAKSIIRFSETNRPEQKTEYLLIGTLISISLSVGVGLLTIRILQ